MITKLLMKLGLGDGSLNAEIETRRRHARFAVPQADVEVGGRAYSLKDWSMGGICFETPPDARLTQGDRAHFTLRFRFPHGTVTVEQQGRIVRASRRGIAAEFAPPDENTRRELERVLDGLHAQGFLHTQVA